MDDRVIRRLDQVDPLFAQFLAGIAGLIITDQPCRSRRFRIAGQLSQQSNLVLFFSTPEADWDRRIHSVLL